MRLALLLTLAFSMVLAGCAAPADDPPPVDDGTTPPVARVLPDPIEDTKTVQGSADPLNFAGEIPCSSPSSQCWRYPFDLTSKASIEAALSWTIPASDFDLYVFEDGVPISSDGGQTPPGTSEAVVMELEPGSYELVVVAWAVGQDTYTVSATFK